MREFTVKWCFLFELLNDCSCLQSGAYPKVLGFMWRAMVMVLDFLFTCAS